MDWLRTWSEWYFRLAPTQPGQGTAWELAVRPSGFFSTTLLTLLAVGIAIGVVAVYVRQGKSLSLWQKLGLIALRLAALGLIALSLTESTLLVTRTGLPFAALLIDTSASMGLQDRYRNGTSDPGGLGGTASPTRLEIARAALLRKDADALRRLGEKHRLRVYQFDESPRPLGGEGEDFEALVGALKNLTAEGTATRPGPAVREVLEEFRGVPPAAIVLLTDGIASTGVADRTSSAVDLARLLSVPLLTVPVGSDQPAIDLQAYDLLAEDVILLGDPAAFSFRVRAHGSGGRPVQAELWTADGKEPLSRAEAAPSAEGQPVGMELSYVPPSEGEYEFSIRVKPWPEEQNTQNNELRRRVRVRREKIRVLLVERLPRWEFRHLKPVLERDDSVELRTVLQESDPEYVQEDRTALPRFPTTRDELFQYDVVILGDVDPAYFNPQSLDHLREFVGERGGGLLLIGGSRFDPAAFGRTPLEALLPVEVDSVAVPAETDLRKAFRLERTPEGRVHPLLRLTDDASRADAIWGTLPELNWFLRCDRRKTGAQVLATHSQLRGPEGKLPILVWQRFGAGQVLFHATDELWQWRRQPEGGFYPRYWSQAVRALSRAKLLGASRGVQVTTDRTIYSRGDTVRVRVQILDARQLPPPGKPLQVIVEGNGQRSIVDLAPRPDAPQLYEGVLSGLAVGSFRCWLLDPASSESPPGCDFQVEVPNRELQERVVDRADLARAATETRGRLYEITDFDRLVDELPAGNPVPLAQAETIPLWNRWELLALVLVCLSVEWVWRQRLGLV